MSSEYADIARSLVGVFIIIIKKFICFHVKNIIIIIIFIYVFSFQTGATNSATAAALQKLKIKVKNVNFVVCCPLVVV